MWRSRLASSLNFADRNWNINISLFEVATETEVGELRWAGLGQPPSYTHGDVTREGG